ncbi:hypothetical protein SAMN04490248_102139 [Salinihabitans flavidus]|uniref:Plastocyanin n=1 Tax=Salinihabitans flavidus TaxID=569882 RepID=A0A1H8ML95_9RHOB|nr:hypothetical protein [Salinihabitans flavidus]SEO18053.1 hypothetical protein SAMN04490248_102139 [Salinihabitans flavidus]
MVHRTFAAAALTVMVGVMPLQAAEHQILIMGDGYFPDVAFVDPGDTVQFVNVTDLAGMATATDASWDSGVLEQNESFTLSVTEETHLEFANGADPETATIHGALSFEPAPLQ